VVGNHPTRPARSKASTRNTSGAVPWIRAPRRSAGDEAAAHAVTGIHVVVLPAAVVEDGEEPDDDEVRAHRFPDPQPVLEDPRPVHHAVQAASAAVVAGGDCLHEGGEGIRRRVTAVGHAFTLRQTLAAVEG